MDGWETRRRRTPGHDWCIVKLGLPGIIHGVVVDTAHFKGNFPEQCEIEACSLNSDSSVAQLEDHATKWFSLLSKVRSCRRLSKSVSDHAIEQGHGPPIPSIRTARGASSCPRRSDAGLACAHPRRQAIDLATVENGGWVTLSSDMFSARATT